jgi:hypothetical protein
MPTQRRGWTGATGQVIRIAVIWAVAMGITAGSAHAEATAAPGERFVLSGVVFAGEGRGLAWLQEPTFTNNYIVAVRPGDSVGPYRVVKILEDQVVLEGPSGTIAVPLAGVPGAATAAVTAGPKNTPGAQASRSELKPIIIPAGDPRGDFPASAILIGAGAKVTGPVAKWTPPPPKPQSTSPARDMSAPASPGTARAVSSGSGQRTPQTIIIPRGDPRRAFPAGDFLIGAR